MRHTLRKLWSIILAFSGVWLVLGGTVSIVLKVAMQTTSPGEWAVTLYGSLLGVAALFGGVSLWRRSERAWISLLGIVVCGLCLALGSVLWGKPAIGIPVGLVISLAGGVPIAFFLGSESEPT